MASSKLEIIVGLVDKFSSGFKNIDKGLSGIKAKVKSMEPAFKSMATVGAIGLGAVTLASKKAVDAFIVQERAEARLAQIAKQVTGATEEEIASFRVLASELQKVGVVGDEVTIAGQSQIASFTKSSAVVTELTDDLLDLAVAQYGSNVSQDQAIQTGNLLGKALQGQLGALTRTGILVSGDFKKAFEEANTEEERAIVLSKIIQDNYGGLNAAARNTAEGGLAAMKNTIGDIWEEVGRSLIPALNKFLKAMVPIVAVIADWVNKNQDLIPKILGVVAAFSALSLTIGTLGLVFGPVIGAVQSLGAAFSFLAANPIILVIAAIGALVASLIWLWNNSDMVNRYISESLQVLAAVFSNTWESIINVFISAWEAIVSGWNSIWEVFTGDVSLALNSVALVFSLFWETIKLGFTMMWEGIKLTFGVFWEVFSGLVKALLSALQLDFSGAWEAIEGIFTGVWGRIGDYFSNIWASMKSSVANAINDMIAYIDKLIAKINALLDMAGAKTTDKIGRVFDLKRYFADGGVVGEYAANGFFPKPRGRDVIPVMASPGEIILNTAQQRNIAGAIVGGGGQTIVIDMKGSTFYGEKDFTRKIEDTLSKIIKTRLRPNAAF